MNDTVSILGKTVLFQGIRREELLSLMEQVERRRYTAGEAIIRENALGDFLYVILGGHVQIAKTIESIGRQAIREFGPGDFFGEMALLDDRPRSAEATALDACELLLISKESFEAILRRCPAIAANVLRTFSIRLRETDQKLIDALEANYNKLREENEWLNEEISKLYPRNLTSRNRTMQSVLEMAKKAAGSPITILLLGESGTGKEVLARALHQWSDRRKGPFIPINCAALPSQLLESELFGHERGAFTGATQMKKGKFELADGGTAFLDEIGDMAGDTQAKVLRFLQEQEFEHVGGTKTIHVNVRVIAATNRDLERAMKEGKFREDLYYRLNVVALTLPPLRERKEDLDDIADYFLRRFAHEMKKPVTGFADDVQDAFRNYSWPGNIRELSNVIERAVALSDAEILTRLDLPPAIVEPGPVPSPSGPAEVIPYQEAVERAKQEVIRAALEATKGNQSRAAEMLGVERTYLSRLMKQFGMR
jgi:transcriptional regulator with PAS, ATPase and Fis domain